MPHNDTWDTKPYAQVMDECGIPSDSPIFHQAYEAFKNKNEKSFILVFIQSPPKQRRIVHICMHENVLEENAEILSRNYENFIKKAPPGTEDTAQFAVNAAIVSVWHALNFEEIKNGIMNVIFNTAVQILLFCHPQSQCVIMSQIDDGTTDNFTIAELQFEQPLLS